MGPSGMQSRVLTLTWPPQGPRADRFETTARRLRYQALGRGCRDENIASLLLAHHDDDQAETVLMRLANGYTGLGLRGIKACTAIPECFGLHGVYQSGAEPRASTARKAREGSVVHVERGGVVVYRPLLSFSKEQLVATCRDSNTEWFEDHTNADPTTTSRNAIRLLFARRHLPHALRKPALLAMSQRAHHRATDRAAQAEDLFNASDILSFDVRSGTLLARLPQSLSEMADGTIDRQSVGASLLGRMLSLVSPQETIATSKLLPAVRQLFASTGNESAESDARATTIANVKLSRVRRPISDQHDTRGLDPRFIWFLSRQPYRTSSAEGCTTHSNLPTLTLTSPPSCGAQDPALSSRFQLWDGRYWIRVVPSRVGTALVQSHRRGPLSTHSAQSHSYLKIRPLRKEDSIPFRRSFDKSTRRKLDALLRDCAPGHVRWTLPALVRVYIPSDKGDKENQVSEREEGREKEDEQEGLEEVLALPSLGISIDPEKMAAEKGEGVCSWEIRYKKVDLGRHGLGHQR